MKYPVRNLLATISFLLLLILATISNVVLSGPVLYVHDNAGKLATLDATTGNVDIIGNMGVTMTDIAFSPTGDLYGISFGRLYSIDIDTAQATLIGNHAVPGGNTLAFGEDGTLYAAGYASTSLYTLDIINGVTTNLGNMGFFAGGDLAFHNEHLYMASSNNKLVDIDLDNLSNTVAIGSFGLDGVFGLATGSDNNLYAVANTTVFSVDTATGGVIDFVSFAKQGLGKAFGLTSFIPDVVIVAEIAEPATLMLLLSGLFGFRRFKVLASANNKRVHA